MSAAPYTPRTLRSDLMERGRLPVEECLRIGLRLTSALAHLHQHGLVHRDVKPSNVIFVHGEAKLADVGLVTESTEARSFVGTVGYIPPDGPGSPQADLFGLGKVLYEISTGCKRDDFPKLPPDLHELPDREDLVELNEVILKACEDNPKARYQSAEEMSAHLRRVQDGKSVRRIRWLEKRLALGRKVGLALLGSALVAGLISYQSWRGRQVATRAERVATEHLSRMHLDRGIQLMQEGDLFGSLLRLTKAMNFSASAEPQQMNHRIRIGTVLRHCPKPIGLFVPETGLVTGAEFSPDGRQVLTLSDDHAVRLWDLESGRLLHTLGHAEQLMGARFSPDGRWIVSTTDNAQAQVWDAASGQPTGPPFVHCDRYYYGNVASYYLLALATNGVRIIKNNEELVAERVEFPQGPLTLVLGLTGQGDNVQVRSRVLNEAGETLFDRTCLDGPLADLQQTGPREESPSNVGARGIAILGVYPQLVPNDSSDHEVIFDDLEMAVYDARSDAPIERRMLADFNDNQMGNWTRGGWLQNAGALVVCNQQLILTARHLGLGHQVSAARGREDAFAIEEGRTLELRVKVIQRHHAIAQLVFWIPLPDVHQRRQMFDLLLQTLAFSPDGRRLAHLVTSRRAEVRELASGQTLGQPLVHSNDVRDLWFSADSQTVFTVAGAKVRLWDASSGQPLPKEFARSEPIVAATMSGDGRWLASLGSRELRIWDVPSGAMLDWPVTNIPTVSSSHRFAWSPDGSRLLFTSADQVVQCLDRATGKPLLSEFAHEYPVRHSGFSPDGRRLVTVTSDHLAHLWNVADGKPIGPPLRHSVLAGVPRFSPDGQCLLTVEPTRGAWVWDLSKLNPLTLPLPVSRRYSPSAHSANGRFRLSFAKGTDLTLQDRQSGQSVPFPRSGYFPPVKQVKFSADSRWLVVEGRDGGAQVWDTESGDLLTPRLNRRYDVALFGLPALDLPGENRPVGELVALAEVLAGSRLDPAGGTVPLAGKELAEAWGALRRRYPEDLALDRADSARWHQDQARQCEQDWDWWGAQFHLNWLLDRHPDQVQHDDLQERLGYARQALGQAEAQAASWLDRVKAIPPRPPHATRQMLDLTPYYNRSVKADFWTGEAGPNHLGELPCGVQILAGVPFDIRGLIHLRGAREGNPQDLLETQAVVAVGQVCQRIHFLHAADSHTNFWDEIGRYLIHFADGIKREEIPVCFGADLFPLEMEGVDALVTYRAADLSASAAVPAWAGSNPVTRSSDRTLRLFKFTWQNPAGPRKIDQIELTSGQKPGAAPFVVAITVE